MQKSLALLVAVALILPTPAMAKRVSCKSFKTQAAAQAYYVKHKAKSLGWRWTCLRLLTWGQPKELS